MKNSPLSTKVRNAYTLKIVSKFLQLGNVSLKCARNKKIPVFEKILTLSPFGENTLAGKLGP